MTRALLLGILTSSFTLISCSNDTPSAPAGSNFAEGVLSQVRQPGDSQFPTAESVVKFLFEQVKRRDLSEASKVFPIRERFDKETAEAHAEYLKMFNFHHSPLPGTSWHNLQLALGDLDIYDQVGLMCLGFDPAKRRILDDKNLSADVAELKERLDHSRLMSLQIDSLSANDPQDLAENDVLLKTIGGTKTAFVDVEVTCEETTINCTFRCVKIGSNWRVNSLYEVTGLEDDTWRTR